MRYTNKYDDIINLPHHVSKTRPQMSIHDRAAQFSPFAALTGHGAAIKETERLTERRLELDESEISVINERLQMIQDNISNQPEVLINYFIPDNRKMGGKYVTLEGHVKKIDYYHKVLIFEDDTVVPIEELVEVVLL